MTYLIDTDVVIGYLNNRPRERALLGTLAPDGLTVSLITYGEVYEGIYYGADPRTHEQGFLAFLRWVTVLPLNKPIMKRYARLRGQLRRTGLLIGDADTLITATALHHDLTLVTGNVRHFSRVPGLALLPLP